MPLQTQRRSELKKFGAALLAMKCRENLDKLLSQQDDFFQKLMKAGAPKMHVRRLLSFSLRKVDNLIHREINDIFEDQGADDVQIGEVKSFLDHI